MKSVEEIKTEITNNSYPIELSNGQTIYIDGITSTKIIIVYVKDEKNPYGFKKVVSVSKDSNKEAVIERIEDYADNIDMPSLINYRSTSECNNACSLLIEEIANAILNEPATENVVSQIENGEVYSRFKEEIEEMKQLDSELYSSYLVGVYNRKKSNVDIDIPATSDFSFNHNNIRCILFKLSEKYPNNPNIESIKKRIIAKWDLIETED